MRGRREGSIPPGRGAAGQSRGWQRRQLATLGRGWGVAKPPPDTEGRWEESTVASMGAEGVKVEKEAPFSLRIKGLLMNKFQRSWENTVLK